MKPFIIFSCSLLLIGCDILTLASDVKQQLLSEVPAAPTAVPKSDFSTITGERYEKYYFTIDPSIWDKQITIGGSYSLFVQTEGTVQNAITLNNIPLRYFFENGTYDVNGSGTIWYKNTAGTQGGTNDKNFSRTMAIPFEGEEAYKSTIRQEYAELKTFEHQSFVLPKTSDYENSYHLSKYVTLTYNLTMDQFKAFASPAATSAHELLFSDRTDPIPVSATLFESFTYVSRNFYQYKSLVIQFDPALVVHYVFPTLPTVVSALDLSEENVLTVTFAEYSEPFEGPIFSYIIQYSDGTSDIKTFSIE